MDRRDAWREVARRTGGSFAEGKRKSKDVVAVDHGPWTLALDTYTVNTGQASVTYTRARAFFVGRIPVELVVRRRSIFDSLLESFGVRGIASGDREMARRYVAKGKPESRARFVITPGLKAALLAQPSVRLEVKAAPRKQRRTMGPYARVVTARVSGVVTDPERLIGLLGVVRESLDGMERAGVAAREAVAGARTVT